MSMNFEAEQYQCGGLFDPNYFSRQDDLLNAFKGANTSPYSEPNLFAGTGDFAEHDLFENKMPANFVSEHLDSLSNFKDLGSLDKDLESVEATIDNYESSELAIQDSDKRISWIETPQATFKPIQDLAVTFDQPDLGSNLDKVELNSETDICKDQTASVEDEKSVK